MDISDIIEVNIKTPTDEKIIEVDENASIKKVIWLRLYVYWVSFRFNIYIHGSFDKF